MQALVLATVLNASRLVADGYVIVATDRLGRAFRGSRPDASAYAGLSLCRPQLMVDALFAGFAARLPFDGKR